MNNINFIAIDFETATAKRSSICEAGICVVKGGKVVETKSYMAYALKTQLTHLHFQRYGRKSQRISRIAQYW